VTIRTIRRINKNILDHIVEGYKKLQTKNLNAIHKSELEVVYTLKFKDVEEMFKEIYVFVRKKYNQMIQMQIGVDEQSETLLLLKMVVSILNRLFYADIYLPCFMKDLKILNKT
jgi:hypothetical protein